MKKIVTALFVLQILIMSLYGLLVFRGITINNLLFEGKSSIMVNFWYSEEYEFFLNLFDEKDINLYRYVFPDSNSVNIYTTDITLGGNVQLLSGVLPANNTAQFISTINTGEPSQSGVFSEIYPHTNVKISHIDATQNFDISGIYYIETTDVNTINNIVYELSNNINYVEFLAIGNRGGAFFLAVDTIVQIYEFIIITILIFLCVLLALAQYAISQLKPNAILLLHGYSKGMFLKITTLKIFKILAMACFIGYLIFATHLIYIGYFMFLPKISFYFIIFCIGLIFFYTVLVNIFIILYLHKISILTILKGKRPYAFMQGLNHGLKLIFTIFLLVTINFSIQNFNLLNQRLNALATWENAQNYYRLTVSCGGRVIGDLAADLEVHNKQIDFYKDISTHHNAFIMDASNFFWLEQGSYPFLDMEDMCKEISPYPNMCLYLSPHGKSVTISPNYLNVNPIVASNGIPIQEQIIYDNHILNILVPESLRPYQNYILRQYLDYFYFNKVTVENIYNYELGNQLNTTPIENLGIHIIYVENGQKYFTFNSYIRANYGNKVQDPIAIIYTGNLGSAFLGSSIARVTFFYSEATNAYEDILPFIMQHDLQPYMRWVESAYDQNGMAIAQLRQQYRRSVGLAIILLISNLTITYNLISNYFEKNKYKLFVKHLFGYSVFKRNGYFMGTLLIYSLISTVVISLFLGTKIIYIGLLVITIDLIVALIIDQILINKSFNEIIKGDH